MHTRVLILATTLGQQDPEHSAVYGNDVVHEDVEEDDCVQSSAADYVANDEWNYIKGGEDWKGSPLSKVYRKRGTPTIDRLKALGIIEIF